MDKTIIEKYKSQMLKMYGSAKKTATTNVNEPYSTPQTAAQPIPEDSTGKLIAIVTTLRALYPLKKATVTVFTGDYDNMQVVARDTTDQSGRTKEFILKTPAKSISLDSNSTEEPFARYNLLVEAEGYLDNIHLNIPVFSGVTSIQSSNMMLLETAGVDKGPQIFDESQAFGLN